MDVVMIVIILVIGIAIGFIASRFLSASAQDNDKLLTKINDSERALAQYKLDVAEHLESSAKLLEQMNGTCQTAMIQMKQSTELLQQATPTEIDGVPFFSKETQEQLAQTVALRRNKEERKVEVTFTEPPLDYSGEASGLFEDKKQSVTNVE